ncbi:4Fe-4S binding protein [Oceaniglobus indicus]|uniref:4Fe-4S binding protein n=1 Tax=Oceaniglobus indicus TaxID=2047749 RepID=UPI000C17B7F9|nr:4Fe-4S binding protein [Oceaniglobus indicus]
MSAVEYHGDHRARLMRFGLWLRDHRGAVMALQWGVVVVYAVLLIGPAILPLPPAGAHVWDNLTLLAQFLFWGVWWPGVLLSMLVFGRLWCGLFCPEGALSEFAARHGRGRATPRWIRWKGWPFTAFVLTTVYGQMISVYQYPLAVLLILGGSTLAAMAVGWMYGRNKRVWCRYLCPVNGVFGLLAKLAPVHYGVDRTQWSAPQQRPQAMQPFTCAPLVAVKTMQGTSACHMCGRCAGYRDAVELKSRRPDHEVVNLAAETASIWDSLLIITGLMGVAIGAFQWSASPWFVGAKQALATWLVQHDVYWPLEQSLPWYLLTNYPARNDVLTLLDGAVLMLYITVAAVVISAAVGLPLALAVRISGTWNWRRFHHVSHGLIPLAAVGVILGLSSMTVTQLRADGFALEWIGAVRFWALAAAVAASGYLLVRILARQAHGVRLALASGAAACAFGAPLCAWWLLFWHW